MNNMPPSYVPPGPPPRRGPNCWLVGGLTCLGIVILFFIIIIAFGVKLFHSSTIQSAFRSGAASAMCKENMQTIQAAIVRYHDHTGNYPASLSDLVPDYLPDSSVLHCSLDPNTDPKHITFIYTKPTGSSSPDDPLLTLHWTMTMTIMGTTQTIQETEIMTLGGTPKHEQTQTSMTTTGTTGAGG